MNFIRHGSCFISLIIFSEKIVVSYSYINIVHDQNFVFYQYLMLVFSNSHALFPKNVQTHKKTEFPNDEMSNRPLYQQPLNFMGEFEILLQ